MDGGAGDAVSLGQLAEAVSAFAVPQDGKSVELERFASDVPAFETGAAHAGAHPLDDQISFQLRNRSDDDHNSAAQRSAGIDLLAEADELDVLCRGNTCSIFILVLRDRRLCAGPFLVTQIIFARPTKTR